MSDIEKLNEFVDTAIEVFRWRNIAQSYENDLSEYEELKGVRRGLELVSHMINDPQKLSEAIITYKASEKEYKAKCDEYNRKLK